MNVSSFRTILIQTGSCSRGTIVATTRKKISDILTSLPANNEPSSSTCGRHFCSTAAQNAKEKFSINIRTDQGVFVADAKEGDSIFDVVRNNNLAIDGYGACEGTIACSTCHVVLPDVEFDHLSKRITNEENELLDMVRTLTPTNFGSRDCLSLSGCGFLAPYLLGAVIALGRYKYWWNSETIPLRNVDFMIAAQQAEYQDRRSRCGLEDCDVRDDAELDDLVLSPKYVAGASAGALLGAAIIAGGPCINSIWKSFNAAASDARSRFMGPFNSKFSMEPYMMMYYKDLPDDAHLKVSGRLVVSLTHAKTLRNVLVNEWSSKEDLMQCLRCSCYIPFFSSGQIPMFRGQPYVDGGFTNKLPTPYPLPQTVTVSPFAGCFDIAPEDLLRNFNLRSPRIKPLFFITKENILRCSHALFPQDQNYFHMLFSLGYLHAINFMKREMSARLKT